jgi:hypothetical protein
MIYLNEKVIEEEFEKLKKYDSIVFVHIPIKEIKTQLEVRRNLERIEIEWMGDFNRNQKYNDRVKINGVSWNCESRIYGDFGDERISLNTKIFRSDGTHKSYFKRQDDWRTKRGFLICDHYGVDDVVAVHAIADNLEEFLRTKDIKYKRKNFLR